jgi:gluconolactonase
MEMKEEGVYRIDSPGKVTRILAGEVDRPNGVLVSPNDHYLFVADNNNNTAGGARKLWRFRLRPDGTVEPGSKHLLHDWETGRGPDGLKMDQQGRFYVAGGRNNPTKFETADKFKGGVYVLNQRGRIVGFIPIPTDEVTNCAFGGPDWKTLYITAGGTLWSIDLDARGWTPLSGLEK